MTSHRYADTKLIHIDCCLQILGIRVWEGSCQLIAKGSGEWGLLGPRRNPHVEVPCNELSLKTAASDTLLLTAWQYDQEHRGTDIGDVLAQRNKFSVALTEHDD